MLFNYQSQDWAIRRCLTILATREGTSATIIDNTRDAHNCRRHARPADLFNQHGQRASLTGKRRSDAIADEGEGSAKDGQPASVPPTKPAPTWCCSSRCRSRTPAAPMRAWREVSAACAPAPAGAVMEGAGRKAKSDVEDAVVGHGKVRRAVHGGRRPRHRTRRTIPDPRDRAVLQGDLERRRL